MCNKLLIPYVFPEAIQDFYEMITYQIWKKKKKPKTKHFCQLNQMLHMVKD